MNKLAIVTGATGGIGSVIAHRLWQEGYGLWLFGRDAAKLSTLVYALRKTRQERQVLAAFPLDMAATASLQYFAGELRCMSARDHYPALLVCAHGAAPIVQPTLDLTPAHLLRVLHVDVLGTFALCQMVLPFMMAQRHGSITFISSLHAQQTYPRRIPYATSKAALNGMMRAMAVEYGAYAIAVNSLCPWQTEGPRTEAFIDAGRAAGVDVREQYLQRSPQRRLVTPEEIAETVLWLTHTPSVTGQEIVLDTGVSVSMWYKGFTDATHSHA